MKAKKHNKKTIAIFNAFYLPHLGGVERYTSKIVELLKKKYNIIIITTNDDNAKSYVEEDNIKIFRLPTHNLCKKRYPFLKKNKEYKELINRIKSIKIDYVICNTRFYQTSLLGCKISKEKKSKLFFIDHSSNHVSIGNKILDRMGAYYEHYLTYKIKKYNPKFYGVSKKCNEWLKHFSIEASGVFYNSIDKNVYNQFYKKNYNKKIIFGYIGRIIPEKGILNLLEAFTDLEKKYKNIELRIAGDGPLLKQIKQKYNSKNIKYLGKLSYEEVMQLSNELDIFVHPSQYPEGLPTSILEAGIMKTAVIATDRGGTKEVINSNKIGIIVEENIHDLEKKMEYLIVNPKEIEKLKENIHNRIIKNFIWEKTVRDIERELEK